jgi:hypothetical protein
VGKLYGHFKGSVDTVKQHVVEVLHKNVAYDRTRVQLFSLSGRAQERARVLRLARRPSVGSSPCMRLARSPWCCLLVLDSVTSAPQCIRQPRLRVSTLGDAASTTSTVARSWTGLTRERKPVRATRSVSIVPAHAHTRDKHHSTQALGETPTACRRRAGPARCQYIYLYIYFLRLASCQRQRPSGHFVVVVVSRAPHRLPMFDSDRPGIG